MESPVCDGCFCAARRRMESPVCDGYGWEVPAGLGILPRVYNLREDRLFSFTLTTRHIRGILVAARVWGAERVAGGDPFIRCETADGRRLGWVSGCRS
ncbi:MAG: hypothetical protein H5T64_11455 [Chloroflexi bacterium]|nr:hypothetical protein [Chloroflexota bacterium]